MNATSVNPEPAPADGIVSSTFDRAISLDPIISLVDQWHAIGDLYNSVRGQTFEESELSSEAYFKAVHPIEIAICNTRPTSLVGALKAIEGAMRVLEIVPEQIESGGEPVDEPPGCDALVAHLLVGARRVLVDTLKEQGLGVAA